MVHLSPQSEWRRRLDRLAGIGIVVLGVVVLVAAIIAIRQPKSRQAAAAIEQSTSVKSATASAHTSGSSMPPTAASGASSSPQPSPAATSTAGLKSVPLVVLNSTSVTGLAQRAASTFETGGWTVTNSGNIQNNILSTCAYYDASSQQNLQVANALMAQFPAIKRVKEKFDGLPAGPVVVVLTSDYS
jgi:hypothetical protein